MSDYERQCFKRVLELNNNAIQVSKGLRTESFKNRDQMLSQFSSNWANYEELFSIMKSLIQTSRGELNQFFTGCYESYVNDYNLLKADMGDLLLKNDNTAPLRNTNSKENKIL